MENDMDLPLDEDEVRAENARTAGTMAYRLAAICETLGVEHVDAAGFYRPLDVVCGEIRALLGKARR